MKRDDGVRVTKVVGGQEVEVDLASCWNSLGKVIKLARLAAAPDPEDQYGAVRLAYLRERLEDLDGLQFYQIRYAD